MLNISDVPLNLLTVKHQNSILENKIRDTSTPQSGSLQTPIPEDVVHQKNKLHSPCENDRLVNLVDPKHSMYAEQDGLGSTGLDQETIRNQFPILVEDRCSQDDCGVLNNVDSDGFGKKRVYIDGHQNDCSTLDAKVLRSVNHLTQTVLPRRSTRLLSK